jgi:beta-glucosidase
VAEGFKGEIIVTENGIASSDDSEREAFIKTALSSLQEAIKDGVPLKGHCCLLKKMALCKLH